MLQCCVRQFLSRNRLHHLRSAKASTQIQCIWRQHLARKRRYDIIRSRAATVVQAYIRRYLARIFCVRLRRHRAAAVIQKWAVAIVSRFKCAAINKIIRLEVVYIFIIFHLHYLFRIARKWLSWRNACSRKISRIIKKNYILRSFNAKLIGRCGFFLDLNCIYRRFCASSGP